MVKKGLVIFSPGFAANEQDTSCIPALQQFILQVRMIKPELDIKVFSLHYPFKKGPYKWNGISCYSFGGKNKGKPYSWFLRSTAKKHLKNVIKVNPSQVILSIWMWDCALIAQELMHELNVPHFCWMHGQDARAINTFVKQIQPASHQVISISDILQNELEKNHGIRSAHVVENGITETLFPEFNTEKREFDIVGAGSFNPNKNYGLFVEVIAELKKQFPDIKCALIGDGEQKEMIRKKIKDLDLSAHIMLKGLIPHNEVLQYMSKSKIFLHTSGYEGSSGVIMEALYSGCYVVSTMSVSPDPVKNVQLADNAKDLAQKAAALLLQKDLKHERVVYNTRKNSAEKIISILDL